MRRYAPRDDEPVGSDHGHWPGAKAMWAATAKDNRLFVEAVLFRFRAGLPWRDLPERFALLEDRLS